MGLGVPLVNKWDVHIIQRMYFNSESHELVSGQCNEKFGVHQNLCSEPVALHPIARGVFMWIPHWSAMGAFSMLITWYSLGYTGKVYFKLKSLKADMESKWLHVNVKENKFLVYGFGLNIPKNFGKYPVLTTFMELAKTPWDAYISSCGSIGNAVLWLVD